MKVVFKTPGLLDLRAMTTFGLHAKPNSDNPIGKFGTGLKYAIAVLLREGAKVRLFIGETEYEFYLAVGTFRDQEYQQVKVRKRNGLLKRWQYETLPFTTAHGKFWQLWQAFRELESNTRDEGGVTFVCKPGDEPGVQPDTTIFEIESQTFLEVYENRDEVFLPKTLSPRSSTSSLQVFNEASNYLYWRGIRVFDLEKPSMYTYNILSELELTEDRTLKNVYYATGRIAEACVKSEDERWINAVIAAKDSCFEYLLDFNHVYTSPGQVFKDIMAKKILRDSYYRPGAFSYFERYAPKVEPSPMSLTEELQWHLQNCESHQYRLRTFLERLTRCVITEPAPEEPDDLPF